MLGKVLDGQPRSKLVRGSKSPSSLPLLAPLALLATFRPLLLFPVIFHTPSRPLLLVLASSIFRRSLVFVSTLLVFLALFPLFVFSFPPVFIFRQIWKPRRDDLDRTLCSIQLFE